MCIDLFSMDALVVKRLEAAGELRSNVALISFCMNNLSSNYYNSGLFFKGPSTQRLGRARTPPHKGGGGWRASRLPCDTYFFLHFRWHCLFNKLDFSK
jgi:hypothetical protein